MLDGTFFTLLIQWRNLSARLAYTCILRRGCYTAFHIAVRDYGFET